MTTPPGGDTTTPTTGGTAGTATANGPISFSASGTDPTSGVPTHRTPIGVPYGYLDNNGVFHPWTSPPPPTGPEYGTNVANEFGNMHPVTRNLGGVPSQDLHTGTAPQYFEGDEWGPANLPPDGIYQLQQQLAQAGLYDQSASGTGTNPIPFQPGHWDTASRDAYKRLLGEANATGNTWQAQLSNEVKLGPQRYQQQRSYEISVTPAAEILYGSTTSGTNGYIHQFETELGRAPSAEEKMRFVADFQNQERAYQKASIAVKEQQGVPVPTTAGPGSPKPYVVTETQKPPSLDAAIQQDFVQNHPVEYQGTQIGAMGAQILQLLAGQQPNPRYPGSRGFQGVSLPDTSQVSEVPVPRGGEPTVGPLR